MPGFFDCTGIIRYPGIKKRGEKLMNSNELEQKARNFFVRCIGYSRGKYGLSPRNAVKRGIKEDPEGYRAFMERETNLRHETETLSPKKETPPVSPTIIAEPQALPPQAETTDEGQQTTDAPAAASLSEAKEEPRTFEAEVAKRIRQGATPEQAVRGTASMYPKLQADYFRRIREGQVDQLADVWK